MGVVRGAVVRPAVARPGSRIPDPVRLLQHWRKLFWLSVAVALLAGGDMLLAKYGPDLTTETVETGASFSVSAGSFATESRAAVFASTLDASGLPILVHMRPDDRRYQVMVGPYVSTDEAERAQRKLAAWGLGDARLVVDDTMRSQPQQASIFGFGESASNGVVMVAASGVSSLVFEMHDLPKEVEAKRTSPTTIDVAIGRTSSSAAYEPLRLPEGVSLVRQLFVRSHGNGIHAHLIVPQDIESRLRLEGRRVYLDLAFPRAPWSIRREAAPAPKGWASCTGGASCSSRWSRSSRRRPSRLNPKYLRRSPIRWRTFARRCPPARPRRNSTPNGTPSCRRSRKRPPACRRRLPAIAGLPSRKPSPSRTHSEDGAGCLRSPSNGRPVRSSSSSWRQPPA